MPGLDLQRDLCFAGIQEETNFRRFRVLHQAGTLKLNEAVRLAVWFTFLAKSCRTSARTGGAALLGLLASALIFLMPAKTPLR